MNELEAATLINAMRANWNHHYKDDTREDFQKLLKAWVFTAEDIPYEQMARGLKVCMRSNMAFPPTVGQVIEASTKADKIVNYMGESEAWELVYRAISNSLYNAEGEFDKLPDDIKAIIKDPAELRRMASKPLEVINNSDQAQFKREFNAYIKRKDEREKLPPKILLAAEQTAKQLEQKNEIDN